MKEIDLNGFCNLSYEELIEISGGTDPGDAVHDFGIIIGKIGGWIKNAFTAESNDEWMLDVDPKVLFG